MVGETTPLHLGIAAIKSENYEEARKHLVLAISKEPESAEPWLWLGIIAENLDERIQYLEQAVSLQSDNKRAVNLLKRFRQQRIDTWIQNGMAEVQAGNTVLGIELLAKAISADETNVDAWWWLGQASMSPADQIVCYENVLTLNPEHSGAQLALKALEQINAVEAVKPYQSDDAAYDFQGVPSANFNDKDEPVPQLTSGTLAILEREDDLLSSELGCPYCAVITNDDDQRCPQCNRSLFLRESLFTQPKSSYKILAMLECGIALGGILVQLIMLAFLDMFINTNNRLDLLSAYYVPGRPAISINTDIAFSIISPLAMYAALAASFIAILIVISVLSRWQPLFYTAVGLSSLRILVIILNIVLVINGIDASTSVAPTAASGNMFIKASKYSLIGSIGIVGFLSAIGLILLINNHDHFAIKLTRRLLQLDRDVIGSSAGLRQRARVYAKERAWALAALHARESLLVKQEVEGFTLLATAYYHLGWQERVSQTLDDALAISPQNPQLIELRYVLEQQMSQNLNSEKT